MPDDDKTFPWSGRTAWVTGASAGIGTAVAEALVGRGMNVVLSARRQDRLIALAERLQGEPGACLVAPADMRDEASIQAALALAKAKFGGVDVLVNNAGLGHMAPLSSGDTEAWREMLEVNVLGLTIATREVLQDLAARDADGYIVHISSMAAHRVPPGSGMYSATKHAVRALTEALRKELVEAERPVRVSAISPGFVETEFAAHYHGRPEAAEETYGRYPVLQPADVAEAVLYVLGTGPEVQVQDVLLRPRQQAN